MWDVADAVAAELDGFADGEDVGGLDVLVDEMLVVQGLERGDEAGGDLTGLLDGESAVGEDVGEEVRAHHGSKGAKSAVPLADRAIGNLQQWLIGTYHGVSKPQLQIYLDEFVFRHNRRKTPAASFQTLLGLGTSRKSTEYEQIRGAKDLNPNILGLAESTG